MELISSQQPPTNTGTVPGMCAIVIRGYANTDKPPGYPENVGYTRGISYTVDVQLPSGVLFGVEGVVPSVPRVPFPYLATALPIEEPGAATKYIYPGVILAGRVYLAWAEDYYSQLCEGGA